MLRLLKYFDLFLRNIAISLIKLYQFLFKNKPRTCRFEPTCSEYALSAFKKYYFLKAFLLSFIRILKCNPLFSGGFDPLR
ncbi:MAG: membrane protein insertion efficiency factor YidD [bacterium]|nr:membrane protein insertion efficiency factor YidD [bacterium]